MKKRSSLLAFLAALPILLFFGCSQDSTLNPDETSISTDTYIVVLDLNADKSIQANLPVKDRISSFITSRGIALESVSSFYSSALTGFAAKLNSDQLDALRADKVVRYIEENKVWTLSDPEISKRPGGGGGTTPPYQTIPWGIETVGHGTPRTGVRVWIIDTGIDLDHSDLNVNTEVSRTFVATGTDSYSADDGNGHGTHCAGIIGAKDNTIGVVGVAPGVELVAVKVLNKRGSGTTQSILDGLEYVTQNAADGDVVNMSLGYNGVVTSVDQAVYNCSINAGVYISIAAGNETDDAIYHTPARIGYQITIDLTTYTTNNIVSVSAHNSSNVFAYFSNYGTAVEWSAPGVEVYSCYKNNGYATLNGTSMAAPHVAGIMAVDGALSSENYRHDSNNNIIRASGDPDATDDPCAGLK